MSGETVYFVNGRCYSCGGTARSNVRQSWCRGCGNEVGTIGWVDVQTPDGQYVQRLAAAYDSDTPLPERRKIATQPEPREGE